MSVDIGRRASAVQALSQLQVGTYRHFSLIKILFHCIVFRERIVYTSRFSCGQSKASVERWQKASALPLGRLVELHIHHFVRLHCNQRAMTHGPALHAISKVCQKAGATRCALYSVYSINSTAQYYKRAHCRWTDLVHANWDIPKLEIEFPSCG